jgi:hypothetical protein
MAYLIDRQRALRTDDIVAIVAGARRGERSRVTLRDNSLHRTASRSKTLIEAGRRYPEAIVRLAGRSQGATWRKPQ